MSCLLKDEESVLFFPLRVNVKCKFTFSSSPHGPCVVCRKTAIFLGTLISTSLSAKCQPNGPSCFTLLLATVCGVPAIHSSGVSSCWSIMPFFGSSLPVPCCLAVLNKDVNRLSFCRLYILFQEHTNEYCMLFR